MRWLLVLCAVACLGCDDDFESVFYADGTEWKPVMPLSPGGVIPRDMDARSWDRFVAHSGIQADRTVKSFAPTWGSFSSAPTEEINYYDFGALVVLWVDTEVTGTSNDIFMTWSVGSLPAAIRPSAQREIDCAVVDNTTNTLKGSVILEADGSATFTTTEVVGVQLQSVGNNFTNANGKGLPSGWLVMYSK